MRLAVSLTTDLFQLIASELKEIVSEIQIQIINLQRDLSLKIYPCGGGVEYLHRDPASRRRRRKGKSQISESKIWSRVTRDSDPRKTALARASSTYKRQTPPVVREGAPQKQDRNCQNVINI
jgi:hypothetical protein